MRLGAPLFNAPCDPDRHLRAVLGKGYRAAYCPLPLTASDADCAAWEAATRKAGIVCAEVGAWCNPLAPDPKERADARAKCIQSLALADRVGARCCVNISGSRGAFWMGAHPANLTDETFEMIVECVRRFIDEVKPRRTFYTLETMQWMYPDSADSYLRLIKAIDRKSFAVHFDPVNLVVSPSLYYQTGQLIRDFVRRLGPRIRSCHAKDLLLRDSLGLHFDEVRPGLGGLDYRAYLEALAGLDPDLPLMLEHLPNESEYDHAASHLRAVAGTLDLTLNDAPLRRG